MKCRFIPNTPLSRVKLECHCFLTSNVYNICVCVQVYIGRNTQQSSFEQCAQFLLLGGVTKGQGHRNQGR